MGVTLPVVDHSALLLACGRFGVPVAEVGGEIVVEHSSADLEKQVGAARAPAHLLFLITRFADHLIDRGFGW